MSDPSFKHSRATTRSTASTVSTHWTREQIRSARLIPLAPLLEKRGLQLIETGGGNFQLPAFPGLIVKEGYWRWPERALAGNAIDFFMKILGSSFHQAMKDITAL